MLERLITGDRRRKSRFHNARGERIDLAGLIYLPHAIGSTLIFKLTGRRPELPWFGYRAIKRLDQLIQPSWSVLEFGSGMSTLWLAKRCGHLLSVETDETWYGQIKGKLPEGVEYWLRPRAVCHEISEGPFDLAIVDGHNRDRAVETAIKAVKPGGYIFLDNSDVYEGEYIKARRLLTAAARRLEVFNDFYPTSISTNESILAELF